jgi:hypothetical protein
MLLGNSLVHFRVTVYMILASPSDSYLLPEEICLSSFLVILSVESYAVGPRR